LDPQKRVANDVFGVANDNFRVANACTTVFDHFLPGKTVPKLKNPPKGRSRPTSKPPKTSKTTKTTSNRVKKGVFGNFSGYFKGKTPIIDRPERLYIFIYLTVFRF
jgi:hypothetical protein